MKKEVIIAITLGFGLGLIITIGIWTANRALQKESTTSEMIETPTPIIEEEPTPTPEPELEISILQPENNSLLNEDEVTLEGKTSPGAYAVIFTEENEIILETDENGEFTTEVTLIGGVNEIVIKAFDNEGNSTETTLNLVYSTAKI